MSIYFCQLHRVCKKKAFEIVWFYVLFGTNLSASPDLIVKTLVFNKCVLKHVSFTGC